MRAAVSGTSASAVVEGPLGRAHRGAWLVSARQSYLDLLIERLVDDQVQFGFSDAQTKFIYDLSPAQHVELSMLAGRSRLKEPADEVDANDLYVGYNASAVGIAKWRWTSARTVLSGGLLAGFNRFRNETIGGVELDRGRERQITVRFDARHHIASGIEIEAGTEVDALRESRNRQRPVTATTYRVVNDYEGEATRVGVYATGRWSLHSSLAVLPGVRADRWSLTGQSTTSPWLQVQWRPLAGTLVRGATGLYQQFPQFEQIIGAWGTEGLDREKAAHIDVGVEQLLGASARVQLTVYDREERSMLRRAGAETRLADGQLVRGIHPCALRESAGRLLTRCRGHGAAARFERVLGLDFVLLRQKPLSRRRDGRNVLGRSRSAAHDEPVRVVSVVAKNQRQRKAARREQLSSAGYYTEADGRYFISDLRNDVRLPSFARLDLRANRTFAWSGRRLTLFAEVINVLNRENVRYHPPSIDGVTFESRRLFESLLPVVPSAGLLFEF